MAGVAAVEVPRCSPSRDRRRRQVELSGHRAVAGAVQGCGFDAVGRAVAAYGRRFGPVDSPWRYAILVGAAPHLSPPGRGMPHAPVDR
ncbi:MAG: hypothetical protein HYX32_00070 [Actinobacteria bacterium]|nr:hypothetical protein [Actinomycetota bacterium]